VAANFTIKSQGSELRIHLFGLINGKVVRELLAELPGQLNGASLCMVDTGGVSDCVEDARPELVKVQQLVAKQAKRTAWIDDRARFRGVALWVMHLAADPNAKAVATLDQAARWLASTELREESAARRVSA